MERQAFENNDFSGGLSDEYVPTKDNRLDACDNICLDDDLTAIQRPGSAQLQYSDAAYGRHADQTQIQGIFENSQDLVAVSSNAPFKYPKTGVSFQPIAIPDGATAIFNEPLDDQDLTSPASPVTSISGGSVNGYVSRDIIHITNNKLTHPQKIFTDENSVDYVMGVGLPRLPDMFYTSGGNFYPISTSYVSQQESRFVSTIGVPNNGTATFKILPFNLNVTLTADYTSPNASDQCGWSDKPYTYKNGVVVRSNFPYIYQFCLALKMTYKINGVTYVKRSAPTTPSYYLSDTEIKETVSTVGSTTTTVRTLLGITYPEQLLYPIMRAMSLPLLVDEAGYLADEDPFFEMEFYVSDNNSSELYKRDTDVVNPRNIFTSRYSVLTGHNRWNTNVAPAVAGFPAGTSALYYPPYSPSGTPVPDVMTYRVPLKISENRVLLYTSGGILPYDPPPPCKYTFRSGTYSFYLNIKEEEVTYSLPNGSTRKFIAVPYRLKISNANDPDSVPEGNIVDLPDTITGGGDVLDRSIIGTEKEIYRIDGRFDSAGSGLVNGQILSSETGILSHKSVIPVKDRLFFAGDDGIYMTDGIGVLCISRHISRTYRALIQAIATDTTGEFIQIDRAAAQEKISAIYDRVYDRIIFSFGSKCLILELKASRLEEAYGAFYGPWFVGLAPNSLLNTFSALGTFKDMVVRGDQYGYVLQMSPGYTSDPILDPITIPNPVRKYPIIYRLRTTKFAMGSLVVKKWVNYVTFILKRRKVLQGGQSEIDVQVHGYNDGERFRQVLKPAHYNGERDLLFDANPKYAGVPVPKVITDTLVNFQRRFGPSGLRCLSKAVEFTNGLNVVGRSDDSEQALISGNLASLPNYPTYEWPKELQDLDQKNYVIAFQTDNYAQKYSILSASGATLTLDLPPGNGSKAWKLYSYSNKQFFGLHSLGLVYTMFGSKHSTYDITQQGGNSGDAGE